MQMIANFKFYPVGQGCFYAGSINLKGQEFVVVYDCGSISSAIHLQDSINQFKKRFTKIDLLVISHFDKDHVSGLKQLLGGIKCAKVVIPYYSPLMRLALLATNIVDADYISFIQNPIGFLLRDEFQVNEVVVLSNNGNDGTNAGEPTVLPDTPDDFSEGENNIFRLDEAQKDDLDLIQSVKENEGDNFEGSKNVKYLSLPFKLSFIHQIWEFVFYAKPVEEHLIKSFKDKIDELLTKTKYGKISELFEMDFIPSIKELYRSYFNRNLNHTSLVVLHRPLLKTSDLGIFIGNSQNVISIPGLWIHQNNFATMLTGDSFLKKDSDYNNFINYYTKKYIDQIALLQVPHHGSSYNWRNMSNDLDDIPYYIINHGLRGKHPDQSVIENIYLNSTTKNILLNNEVTSISYSLYSP